MSGVELSEFSNDKIKLLMPLEGNKNPFGVMHASSQYILAKLTIYAFALNFDLSNVKVHLIDDFRIEFKTQPTTDISTSINLEE
jgi:hypothetical protein